MAQEASQSNTLIAEPPGHSWDGWGPRMEKQLWFQTGPLQVSLALGPLGSVFWPPPARMGPASVHVPEPSLSKLLPWDIFTTEISCGACCGAGGVERKGSSVSFPERSQKNLFLPAGLPSGALPAEGLACRCQAGRWRGALKFTASQSHCFPF